MRRALAPLALVLALAPFLCSQAAFIETFDAVGGVQAGQAGPSGLIAKGWIFRNQSQPKGQNGWVAGSFFTPQAGAGYLGADSLATDFFGGDISLWALLPAVPGQQAGDMVTVHVRAIGSSNHDTLQVRYSPGGGTGTGSTATSVGDFSQMLVLVDPIPTSGWATVAVPVPGPGRIALRYVVDNACNFSCFASQIGVDTLSVGPAPPPPCNLPPQPLAGQTITWPAAGGPYEVCSDMAIPVGSTVIVEPGTSLVVDSNVTLGVAGTLVAQGTPGAPISISGGISQVTPPLSISGLADLSHVNVTGRLYVLQGGSLVVAESAFPGGLISSQEDVAGSDHGTYVQVDGCDFSNGGIAVNDGTLSVRQSHFASSGLSLLRGWLLVDQVNLQGAGLSLFRERYTQPAWLNGVGISGNAGPAMELSGWDFLLGPDNVITGNGLPVRIQGGLLAGSVVPASGNVQNIVDAQDGSIVGRAHWAALDVPWVVKGISTSGGSLRIEPGAVVRYGPGAGTSYLGEFLALGLPDAPVRLLRQAAPEWKGLAFVADVLGPRFDNVELEGAHLGVQADDGIVHVAASDIHGCTEGAAATTFGVLHATGTSFRDNGTGVRTTTTGTAELNGATDPNSFVDNDAGVLVGTSGNDATHNWWGHPSGPQSPANPGGQGDSASAGVAVLPFLTSPPPADAAPVLRLQRTNHLLETGQRVVLNWDAQDDGSIVSQRILWSPHGNWTNFFLPLAEGLPGTQRSFEWTVPVVLPSSNTTPTWIRVIAIDDLGQEGFDEAWSSVPYTADMGPTSLHFLTDLSGPFTIGDQVDVCWDYTGPGGTFIVSVENDADLDAVPFGGGTTLSECWTVRMPYLSTDTARIHISYLLGAGNRSVDFFSQRFTIRPDARLPDAPPAVTLLAPQDGASVEGGGTLGVHWAASDDLGVRSIALQASYDAGRTWQAIVEGLPPSTTSYAWTLPDSAGIPAARLRVVANDLRFQSSSDEIAMSVLPGNGPRCQPSLGSAGPGAVALTVCGDVLASGGTAQLQITGAPSGAAGWLVASATADPTPFKGGLLVPVPLQLIVPIAADGAGQFSLPVPGGGGPADVVVQAVFADGAQPAGYDLSNAVQLEFMP